MSPFEILLSSFKKPNSPDHPFYRPRLSKSRSVMVTRRNKYVLVLLSLSLSSACRCQWFERSVRNQPWMTLPWGKTMHKDRVRKQREEWKECNRTVQIQLSYFENRKGKCCLLVWHKAQRIVLARKKSWLFNIIYLYYAHVKCSKTLFELDAAHSLTTMILHRHTEGRYGLQEETLSFSFTGKVA